MKFNPTADPSRTRLGLMPTVLAATALFAVTRGTGTPAGGATAAADTDADEAPEETDETSQDVGTGTGTGTGTAAATGTKKEAKAEAVANVDLVAKIKTYDDAKAQATSYMCDIAEFIAKENLGRPVVIATLMEARGLTIDSAASNASRLMKLAKNPDLIKALREGTATIRETVYGKGKTSNSGKAEGGEGGEGASASGASKKTDAEKKEDKYNRLLSEFVAIAKECGYSAKDITTGFTAALKDAGVK